jgi:hypothetical protein
MVEFQLSELAKKGATHALFQGLRIFLGSSGQLVVEGTTSFYASLSDQTMER